MGSEQGEIGGFTGGAKPRPVMVVPMEPKMRLPLKCNNSFVVVDRVLAAERTIAAIN